MKTFLALFLSSFTSVIFAQNTPEPTVMATDNLVVNDTLNTIFKGDVNTYTTTTGKTIHNFVLENYSYPEEAIEEAISGTIYVQFIVEKNGTVEKVDIQKSLSPACDAEAIRVIKSLKVQPILENNQPVRMRFRMPIRLMLE